MLPSRERETGLPILGAMERPGQPFMCYHVLAAARQLTGARPDCFLRLWLTGYSPISSCSFILSFAGAHELIHGKHGWLN